MKIKPDQLAKIKWSTLNKTFGCSHSTIIGLIVDWWNSEAPCNSAFESGPSCAKNEKGKGSYHVDVLLNKNSDIVGVVEVEGSRDQHCIDKISGFFKRFSKLEFGLLVIYPTEPKGRGSERRFQERAVGILEKVEDALKIQNGSKYIYLIEIKKRYEQGPSDDEVGILRKKNGYYRGTVNEVVCYHENEQIILWGENCQKNKD